MSKHSPSTRIISGRSHQHVTPMTPHPTHSNSPSESKNLLFLHSQTLTLQNKCQIWCLNCRIFPLYLKTNPLHKNEKQLISSRYYKTCQTRYVTALKHAGTRHCFVNFVFARLILLYLLLLCGIGTL